MPNNVLCGGTIINGNHIVTAANCVLNANRELLPTSDLLVRAGSNTLATGTPSIGVQAIYIHPQFSPFSYENDVAVIRVRNHTLPLFYGFKLNILCIVTLS